MAEKESRSAASLFHEEEQFLNHAYEMVSNMGDKSICWSEEYKILLNKYEKLLRQSNKLVKISDHAQNNLHMANEKISEKVLKLTETEKKLKQMADTDVLTCLPNRRGTFKQIKGELKRANRDGIACTLLLLDIDHFKRVNDVWGHSAGDFVLKEAARLMRRSLRTQDILGRWGGEEFLILLPRTELKGAIVLSEKVRHTIETTRMKYEDQDIGITISIGGILHSPGADLEKNLELADRALYSCKETGRNKVEFYEN